MPSVLDLAAVSYYAFYKQLWTSSAWQWKEWGSYFSWFGFSPLPLLPSSPKVHVFICMLTRRCSNTKTNYDRSFHVLILNEVPGKWPFSRLLYLFLWLFVGFCSLLISFQGNIWDYNRKLNRYMQVGVERNLQYCIEEAFFSCFL